MAKKRKPNKKIEDKIEDKNYEGVIDLSTIEPTEGLGTTIEKVLNSKILKPLTDLVKEVLWSDSEDCGCEERKKMLNKLIPYKRKVNWLSKDDYIFMRDFTEKWENGLKDDKKATSHNPTIIQISQVYCRVFNLKYLAPICTCSPKVYKQKVEETIKVYKHIKESLEKY